MYDRGRAMSRFAAALRVNEQPRVQSTGRCSMPARFISASTAFSRLLSGLFILLLATLLSPAAAQTVFSAKASGPTGPTGLFRADQGTVMPVNTGLPYRSEERRVGKEAV